MRVFSIALLASALLLHVASETIGAAEPLDLRVLYCGNPGSAREADFRDFLQRHIAKVTTTSLSDFKQEQAKDQDVVIFDWTSTYTADGEIDREKSKFKAPVLDPKFSRPSILIGEAGGKVATHLKVKVDWFCLCLNGPAHKLALNHEVFHSPLEVNPKFEEIPTPAEYPYLTLDKSLRDTMQVWRVQSKDYPDIDPGLVSQLYGFADSPDAEVIAQGVAGKGPDTVALGRHANFFLWGFSAPPADMTPSGQRLFVNVVAYMHRFDGHTPLVARQSRAREWALRFAMSPRFLSEDFRQRRTRELGALWAKHPNWLPAKYKGDTEAAIAESVQKQQTMDGSLEGLIPDDLQKQFGQNADKYLAYYTDNFEYLRAAGGDLEMFLVDEDARALGLSNRHVELLDRCVSMLERNDRAELAMRLLKQYTDQGFASAGEWRLWLDRNRARLFFSDIGGYKFFVNPVPGRVASGKGNP